MVHDPWTQGKPGIFRPETQLEEERRIAGPPPGSYSSSRHSLWCVEPELEGGGSPRKSAFMRSAPAPESITSESERKSLRKSRTSTSSDPTLKRASSLNTLEPRKSLGPPRGRDTVPRKTWLSCGPVTPQRSRASQIEAARQQGPE